MAKLYKSFYSNIFFIIDKNKLIKNVLKIFINSNNTLTLIFACFYMLNFTLIFAFALGLSKIITIIIL